MTAPRHQSGSLDASWVAADAEVRMFMLDQPFTPLASRPVVINNGGGEKLQGAGPPRLSDCIYAANFPKYCSRNFMNGWVNQWKAYSCGSHWGLSPATWFGPISRR